MAGSVSSRDVPPEVSANEVQGIIDYVGDMQPVSETELYRAIGARHTGAGAFPTLGARSDQAGTRPGANRRGRLELTAH